MESKSVSGGGRIVFFDLAKGFCIILVVLYHVSQLTGTALYINDYCKLFRMPLYFFLSGVFFKEYGGFVDFLKRKTNKLLIPFSFWHVVLSVCLSFFLARCCSIIVSHKFAECSFIQLLGSVYYENFPFAPIWFLLCLFEVNIYFYVINLISKKFSKRSDSVLALLSIACGLLGLVLWYTDNHLPLYLDSALTSLPFFYVGYFIRKKTTVLTDENHNGYIFLFIIGALLLLFLAKKWAPEIFSLKYNKFSPKTASLLYPCGIIGTLAVVFLAKLMKTIPPISYIGRYSIMILVTHYPLLMALNPVVGCLHLSKVLHLVVLLVVTLCLYFLLVPFMKKFLPHVTAQKDVIKV